MVSENREVLSFGLQPSAMEASKQLKQAGCWTEVRPHMSYSRNSLIGWLFRGLYCGLLQELFWGILGVQTMAHMQHKASLHNEGKNVFF